MTSSVKIDAHCGDDKEVVVFIYSGLGSIETHTLQDGEGATYHIYGDKSIETFERMK